MPTKVCTKCHVEKEISEFYKQTGGKFGVKSVCKICQKTPSALRKVSVKDGFKLCSKCNTEKPLSDFSKHSSCRLGHRSICKECCNTANVDYRLNHPEQKDKYYKLNKEKIIRNSKKNRAIYREESPWKLTLQSIKQRTDNFNCKDYKWYGGRGVKCLITEEELKELWFRDNASELLEPSIDRIDSDWHYTFENCQYIEMVDNSIKRNKDRRYKRGNLPLISDDKKA